MNEDIVQASESTELSYHALLTTVVKQLKVIERTAHGIFIAAIFAVVALVLILAS
jgi:hypothetical protein